MQTQDQLPGSHRVALSINEVAASLGLSRSTVKNLIATGKLEAVRIGRRVVVTPEARAELLRRGAA